MQPPYFNNIARFDKTLSRVGQAGIKPCYGRGHRFSITLEKKISRYKQYFKNQVTLDLFQKKPVFQNIQLLTYFQPTRQENHQKIIKNHFLVHFVQRIGPGGLLPWWTPQLLFKSYFATCIKIILSARKQFTVFVAIHILVAVRDAQ